MIHEWDGPLTMPVQSDSTDYRAVDLLMFISTGTVRGKGEQVLIEYGGRRLLGNLYVEDERDRFVPLEPGEPVIELYGFDRDQLRVIGVPCVLVRQLL